jgi:hypothetical protein
MKRFEKQGVHLRNEFNDTFLEIKNNLQKQYKNVIEFRNVRYSPEIGMSSYFNYSSYFNIVEINWWQIIHNNKLIGNISTMYEINGNFFEIDIE